MTQPEDKLAAAREAFPEMPEDELEGAIMRAEEHGERMTREKEERRRIARESRRERIASGKPEHGDLTSEEDVVCPHCGEWQPPAHFTHLKERFIETACTTCHRSFGLRIQTSFTYTTFLGGLKSL